jgi:glycosyltransferase involved in cell wall biosynthesis
MSPGGAEMKSPSVVLSLSGGVAFQRYLPQALCHKNILRQAVLWGPDLDIFESDATGRLILRRRFSSYRLCNRLLWAAWRRLPGVPSAPVPLLLFSFFANWAISTQLPCCSVFHGLMGVCLSGLRKAKRMGAVTVVDNPTLHPVAWQREVLAECARTGLRPRDSERVIPQFLLDRHEKEYELCDKIVLYSSAARKTFDPFPYSHKTVVVQPGIDHDFFTPFTRSRQDSVFRVCYVGRIEAPKGITYLLQAWKCLGLRNAELVLVGRIFPEIFNSLEVKKSATSIRCTGILSREEVAKCYQESDLFVLPSVSEGLSLALLEAMSSGLPAIACRETGAEDCIVPGKNGLLVDGKDVDALASAILWCYEHPAERVALGLAARKRIEETFTLSHYAERMAALYEQLLT